MLKIYGFGSWACGSLAMALIAIAIMATGNLRAEEEGVHIPPPPRLMCTDASCQGTCTFVGPFERCEDRSCFGINCPIACGCIFDFKDEVLIRDWCKCFG